MTENEFHEIVSSTRRAMLGAIRQNLSPHLFEWIDDVAQESYLRLYRHLERQEKMIPADGLRSLAYVIARNESIRMNRKLGRESVQQNTLELLPDETMIRERETMDTLSAALSVLDDDLRPVVDMTAKGYTTGEIAAHMKIPAGTVKSRLFRARRKLRDRLNDWFSPGTGV